MYDRITDNLMYFSSTVLIKINLEIIYISSKYILKLHDLQKGRNPLAKLYL